MWDCENCGRTSYWCRCEHPVAAPVLTPEEVLANLTSRAADMAPTGR